MVSIDATTVVRAALFAPAVMLFLNMEPNIFIYAAAAFFGFHKFDTEFVSKEELHKARAVELGPAQPFPQQATDYDIDPSTGQPRQRTYPAPQKQRYQQ